MWRRQFSGFGGLCLVLFPLWLVVPGGNLSIVHATEPLAQMPLSEFKGLIVRVEKKNQIIEQQDKLIKIKDEKDRVKTDYIAKIEQANETIQAYAGKLEEVNARMEQQIAERPIDWVLVAEVAATTLTARWGGGHVWRWGKVLMGR